MILKCNKSSMILIMLASAGLSSCGMKKTNDTNIDRQDVPVVPTASIELSAPKGIVYAQSSLTMTKTPGSLSETPTSHLYTAIGAGGLGVDLDEKNALVPFSGLAIVSNFEYIDPSSKKFSLIATGDKECPSLFSLKKDNTIVSIDDSKVDHLIICNVKVQVSAFSSKANSSVNDEKSIDIALNPTLAMYAAKNDPTFKYLQDYSSLKDVNLIAKWLKDPNYQAMGLNLKYNPKVIKHATKIVDLNALTGAQNLVGINVSDNISLHDIRATLFLQNLQKLSIANTKVDPQDIANLKSIQNLISLDVSNTDLKNLKVVTDNLKNLEELNISGNQNIEDLEDIENLTKLRILKASNIGITDLNKLDGLTQITELDISGNDLSKMPEENVQSLINLYNLSALDVSATHIKDTILNDYFDAISPRNTLKKFVDANKFDREGDVKEDVCMAQINVFDNIQNIRKVKSLEYIDLHGNGCNIHDGYKQIGLTGTEYFSSMNNLKYLDISDTPVQDLSGIAHSKNLKTLHLVYHPVDDERKFVNEGGISMNESACISYFGSHNPLASECDALGEGVSKYQEFMDPGEFEFTTPTNVFKIHVVGCSAGDGGQGGQGFEGTNAVKTFPGGKICTACDNKSGQCCKYNPPSYSFVPAGAGSYGEMGEQGGITTIAGLFSSTQEPYYAAYNGHCGGGSGGNGAKVGANGANKKAFEADLNVVPGQLLKISIPAGGLPGIGGMGTGGGCVDDKCGNHASNGSQGNPGTDGYLKITWYR